MPLPKNPTPRAPSSLITVEKEPERDPEEDCFMCRQAHVYVKPIGMQQERRVARHYPHGSRLFFRVEGGGLKIWQEV